jgi:hypothetical protein
MKTQIRWLLVSAIAGAWFCDGLGLAARGGVAIENPSFEQPALSDGNYLLVVPGWTISAGLETGVLNPVNSMWTGSTSPGSGVPDGNQVLWMNRAGTVSQVLASVVSPNTEYTLKVRVGDRRDYAVGPYTVQLRAGGQILGTASPATVNDGWVTAVVVYQAWAGDPAVGKPIEIALVKSSTVSGEQATFDLVTLDAEPLPVLNFGPIAHWRLDETNALVVHDAVGGHDGVLSGAGAAWVGGGVSGRALLLDRTQAGHARLPALPGLVASDFSVVGWFKTAPGDTELAYPISLSDAGRTNGFWVQFNRDSGEPGTGLQGKGTLRVEDNSHTATGTTDINDGQWHQLAVVYQRGGAVSLHVDGQAAEAAVAVPAITDGGAPLLLGGRFGVETNGVVQAGYSGWVDDVQVYGWALSPSQIAALRDQPGQEVTDVCPQVTFEPAGCDFVRSIQVRLRTEYPGVEIRYTLDGTEPGAAAARYEGPLTLTATTVVKARLFVGNVAVLGSASATYTNVQPTVGLVSHWKFDETSGRVAHDAVGNRNGELTAQGAAFADGGVAGRAVALNRSLGGYARMPAFPGLVTDSFSVLGWVKTAPGDTALSYVLTLHEAWYANGFFVQYNRETGGAGLGQPGKATVVVQDGNHAGTGSHAINDGQWHHLALVYRKGDSASLYVDGAPADATVAVSSMTDRTVPFLVGGIYGLETTGVAKGYFTGWIDDVQIYNRALSEAQMAALIANPGRNLGDLFQPVVFEPAATDFLESLQVQIKTEVPRGVIRYTLDDSEPTAASPAYTAPLELTATTTVKARLFVAGTPVYDTAVATYTQVAPVVFVPPAGLFTNSVAVALVNRMGVGSVRYTTDGSEPTATASLYSTPIPLTLAATIKARVFFNQFPISEVVSADYARVYALADGISAVWRERYFGPGYLTDPRVVAEADPDGDGFSNLIEYQAGTHPLDPASAPWIEAAIQAVPLVSWESVPGRKYRVWRKLTVETPDWTVLVPSIEAGETHAAYVDVTAPKTAIYRIELLP